MKSKSLFRGFFLVTWTILVCVTGVEAALLSSTFIGGDNTEGFPPVSVALDEDGNIYIAGYTSSFNFPTTPDAYDTTHHGSYNSDDVFIAKFNHDLSELLASTYLGGSGNDVCVSITIGPAGDVYVTGRTKSSDFPVTEFAYDTTYNSSFSGEDVFVSRLDGDLTTLLASTFIGGTGIDHGNSVVLDADGNVLIGGSTLSSNFPYTPGAYDTTYNGGSQYGGDVFVARFDADLSTLMQATFLGGSGNEGSDGFSKLAVNSAGEIYVTGGTFSSNFPTTSGAYAEDFNGGDIDGFVSKFNSDLSMLLASTYLGGTGLDVATDVALDHDGNIFVTSHIGSADFPYTQTAFDTTYNGGYDFAVTKLDADLTTVLASTYCGGSDNDAGFGLVIDPADNVYLTGFTGSVNFPTTLNAYSESLSGEYDAFITRFNSDLTVLDASTFIGGSDMEFYGNLGRNSSGEIVLTIATASGDYPTTSNAYCQNYNGGEYDVAVSILDSLLTADPSGIGGQSSVSLPDVLRISSFPNPFNPTMVIRYRLQVASFITLVVYDIAGREVTSLVNDWRNAGVHEATFDGSGLASGMYFYKLAAGDFSAQGKMVLVK